VNPLLWLLIPAVATLLAIGWVTWVNRPRRPADAHDTLAAHRRFTAALERSEAGAPANHGRTEDDPPARSA
jgi:hypothetical protein